MKKSTTILNRKASFTWLISGVFALLFLTLACSENTAMAQGYNFNRSPAISPWVSIGNRPTGMLDSYNQYVRPQLDVQRAFATQQAQINRQNVAQQNMAQSMYQMQSAGATPLAGNRQQAASFRNYLHYYPQSLKRQAR